MDVALRQRIAANEALFRTINERIEQGHWPGEPHPITFRCECARLGCNSMLNLAAAEYERVRRYPRRFVVIAGHELPDVEAVVDRGEGYLVVEKYGPGSEVADATDPRA